MDLHEISLKNLIENETSEKFNNQGYIKCPFHHEKTPSLSVKFHPDANKERFKCFGCDTSGDAIDFIMKYKNLDYKAAREYLGMKNIKTEREIKFDKILSYIEWQINNTEFKEGYIFKGLFEFTNENNEIIYYKAKFLKPDGKKASSYYHFKGDKIINNRGTDEIPYNLYNVLNAIAHDYTIIFIEGEKDANTINAIYKNNDYVATSVKGCIDLRILAEKGIKVYVLGDTGEAGEKYKKFIYDNLHFYARQFKFINLPGIKRMGNNKDVTDWLDAGHTPKDLLNAFDRSLDIKSKYELQQNAIGIYKTIIKEKSEEAEEFKKYLTNFRIIEATRIKFVDEDQEGVKLLFKSPTGANIEKIGPSTVFDDTKSFKNFLGTLDLGFKGKVDDLTDLKSWINKYFALEYQEIHKGVKFAEKNNTLIFIENNGSLTPKGIDINIKSDGVNEANVLEIDPITSEELKELKKYIFKFSTTEKTLSILGTIINNLAVYQTQNLKIKLHHLLIVGESESGKSTILENVIAPILNYPKKDIRSIGLITPFALTKSLSDGNYPIIFDEFKPSSLDRYKILSLSETLRNLYDRTTISRGNKSLKTKDFQLVRPLIMAGEESYPNQEKALIQRSCIVYLSRKERESKHIEAMKWILENEILLRKLGRSLIELILNLSEDEYMAIRKEAEKNIKGLNNRALNTAINTSTGVIILNKLFENHGIKGAPNFEKFIVDNIKTEILDNAKETYSLIEKMLILYNDMIEDGRALSDDVVKYRGDGIFIKTSEMINQIHEHVNRVGTDIIPLKLNDFRKQAQKSGYITGLSNKVIKCSSKTVRYDTYDTERLRELKVYSIVDAEIEEEIGDIPF
ncbi:DNA primase [Clostridium botulinum]|uniref:CHC2 zinc finger domain-containing protein n=1 Tax=Clostridium botulinum TaxID=1491 RepID=UPI001C9A3B92|nr:CHC2 zinc finger domain-containing protein [Clostridium botulinum]MBY6846696.1 DNA primase [Clostridium botulinum]